MSEQTSDRYEATLGPNTKQWWLYDNDNDTYVDPPTEVLNEIEEIQFADGKETVESIDAARDRLEEIANKEQPDWLNDEPYIYPAEDFEI